MSNELLKRILTSFLLTSLSIFFIVNEKILFKFLLALIFIVSIYEWRNLNKSGISFIIGLIFLTISIISAFFLRVNDFSFFIFIIIISVFSDIGGFVFGKIFKGPKLTKISPNKTYSGVLGCFIFSISFGFFFILYLDQFFQNRWQFNFFETFILIVIVSFINQLGDLIISYFKRLNNVKNTGTILPGHGGLLDRIDGIIFTIPCSYLINILYI